MKGNNLPSPILRRFIKKANLVPFRINLDLDLPDYTSNKNDSIDLDRVLDKIFSGDYKMDNEKAFHFFLSLADQQNLRQYPKLFRYLALVAKNTGRWQYDFERIKHIREFIEVLVEIAEEYQIQLLNIPKFNNQLKDSARAVLDSRLPNNPAIPEIKSEKEEILQKLTQIDIYFNLNYLDFSQTNRKKYDRGAAKALWRPETGKRQKLIKKLYEFALGFISLGVENHLAVLSFGDFLDALQGTDLRRLKRCLVCSNAFWAYRLNTKYCSDKCSDNYHQKKQRFDPLKNEIINARRSKNRFNKQYETAQKSLIKAKTDDERAIAQKSLDQALSKRTRAAQKLIELKRKQKGAKHNVTL